MSIILKIHGTGPSNEINLKNRPDMGKKHLPGKAYLSNNNVSFDEYLWAQLKDKDFALHFKNPGQPGFVALKKSSSDVPVSIFSLSLNDIIPELHIPYSASHAMLPEPFENLRNGLYIS